MTPARYKWALVTGFGTWLFDHRPRAVRGGYMDRHGHRYCGAGVRLVPRGKRIALGVF